MKGGESGRWRCKTIDAGEKCQMTLDRKLVCQEMHAEPDSESGAVVEV